MPDPTPSLQPNPAPQPSLSPDPAAPVVPSPIAAKPENLPDRYYDATTGLRTKEIGDTLTAYETEQAKLATTFKEFPDKVEEAGKFYTLPEKLLPDGIKLPDGATIKPDTELLNSVLPVLHAHRVDPAVFQELARAVTAHNVGKVLAADKEFAEDNKKLGANADTRRKALGDRISAIVGPDKAKFLDTGVLSSDAVEFFEAVFASGGGPATPRRDNDPPPQPKTIEQRFYPDMAAQRV